MKSEYLLNEKMKFMFLFLSVQTSFSNRFTGSSGLACLTDRSGGYMGLSSRIQKHLVCESQREETTKKRKK